MNNKKTLAIEIICIALFIISSSFVFATASVTPSSAWANYELNDDRNASKTIDGSTATSWTAGVGNEFAPYVAYEIIKGSHVNLTNISVYIYGSAVQGVVGVDSLGFEWSDDNGTWNSFFNDSSDAVAAGWYTYTNNTNNIKYVRYKHYTGGSAPALFEIKFNATSTILPLKIKLESPIDNAIVETQTVDLKYNVTSNFPIVNASLYTNSTGAWKLNESNTSKVLNKTTLNFTKVLSDGEYLWNVYVCAGDGECKFADENYSFNTNSIGFDDCSFQEIETLNITLRREDNNESIIGNMEFSFDLTSTEGTKRNYSVVKTNTNNTAFCIGDSLNFTADMQASYSVTGFALHTYFLRQATLNQNSNGLIFYLQNGTTTTTFTVYDEFGSKVKDAYIKVLTYDVGTGVFKTVEILKTDVNGVAIGEIVLNSYWYKFIIETDGIQRLSDGPIIMTGTSRTFYIDSSTDFFDDLNDYVGITSSLTYDNNTQNFEFSYSDTSGIASQTCLKVVKERGAGSTFVNESCVTSSASTIYVEIQEENESSFYATGYVRNSDGDIQVLEQISQTFRKAWEVYKLEGVFYSFLIVLTVAMAGAFHPAAAIVFAALGFIGVSLLGWYMVEPALLFSLVLLGFLAAWRIRKE